MEWYNLPKDMRDRNQWVCADDKKQPRNVNDGTLAAVDSPKTWGTYAAAVKVAIANGWDIGFVLSEDDPYTIVDLDDKPHCPAPESMRQVHRDIINGAATYIERSTSGNGFHVVVLGKAPRPIKTQHIEMYSSLRFMICTGDMVKDMPVADGSPLIALIDQHFGHLGVMPDEPVDVGGDLPDQAPGIDEHDDEVIIDRGFASDNGDKFQRLWNGNLDDYDGDHSRADSALLNLLCFLTPHNEQVRRIFRKSALYRPNQRNRTTNKYLNYSIHKWRAENPPINLADYSLDIVEAHGHKSVGAMAVHESPLKLARNAPLELVDDVVAIPAAPARPSAPPSAPPKSEFTFPPGIIGDLADYAYRTSYMPVAEGALAAAIGYVCGLMARGYHINRLGLNQYIVFIADSGVGKEGGKKAIRTIHQQVFQKVPAAQHAIGSSDFSAGVSMVKELAEQPCMLAIAGEIGMTLKVMLDPRAPAHTKELKRALTDAWSESGPSGVLNARKYSDRSKNGQDVKRPCLSMLGESVPSHFYGSLSDESANDGFVPRWLVLEYTGLRPYPNRDVDSTPPSGLVERLQDLFVASRTIQDSNQMYGVKLRDQAKASFIAFEDSIGERVRALPPEHPVKAILNRTNEKALKLAGLLAACENPHDPAVSVEQAEWAQKFVSLCDGHMIGRFEEGSVGEGEQVYDAIIRKAIRAYLKMTPQQRLTNKCPKCAVDQPIIPHAYLHDYLKRRAEIKAHRGGMLVGIKVTIEEALMVGLLVKIPPSERVKIGLRSDGYVLGEGW